MHSAYGVLRIFVKKLGVFDCSFQKTKHFEGNYYNGTR